MSWNAIQYKYFYYFIGTADIKKLLSNKFHKCCWYLGACLLASITVVGILLFYFFFGCAYEIVKCYIKEKLNKEPVEQSVIEENHNSQLEIQNVSEADQVENRDTNVNLQNKKIKPKIENKTEVEEPQEESQYTGKEWCILVTIGFCGFLIQPLYLLFYILYGIMECYRRFNCWFYYAG